MIQLECKGFVKGAKRFGIAFYRAIIFEATISISEIVASISVFSLSSLVRVDFRTAHRSDKEPGEGAVVEQPE
jgi:hypothetical protein